MLLLLRLRNLFFIFSSKQAFCGQYLSKTAQFMYSYIIAHIFYAEIQNLKNEIFPLKVMLNLEEVDGVDIELKNELFMKNC